MVRKLYHGSCSIVEKPVFGQGKRYNDYGLGFYCTDSLEMAKEWGVSHDKDGYANCYELECDGLRILDLNDPQYCILHWLAVLLENREFDVPSALALDQAASLAVTYSQGRDGGKIPVDYTMVRNVRKPSGAMPGKVIYTEYRTMLARGDEDLARRLRR